MALTRPRYSSIVDSDFKQSVRTVTTGDITLTGGAPNVYDGVTFVAGDGVLVAAQANTAQNGIYSVTVVGTGSNGTWSRRFDAIDGTRLTSGTQVPVAGGTLVGQVFRLITPDPITINVTNLEFISAAGTSAGAQSTVQYNFQGTLAGNVDFTYTRGNGNVVIGSTTTSTFPTNGALVVAGGVGIGGNISIGGNSYIRGNFAGLEVNRVAFQNINSDSNTDITAIPSGTGTGAGYYAYDNSDLNNAYSIGMGITTNAGGVTFIESSKTSLVAGWLPLGIAVGGSERLRVDIGGNVLVGAAAITNTSNVLIRHTTPTISATTGALVVSGGAGIGGNVWVAGSLSVVGNLSVLGNTITIGSNNLTVTDSIIDLHSPADLQPLTVNDGRDIGIRFHYYKTNDRHTFLGWRNATETLTYYQDAEEAAGVITGTLGNVQLGSVYISNATVASSTTTGAVVITGGLGIGGNANVQGTISSTGSTGVASFISQGVNARGGAGYHTFIDVNNTGTANGLKSFRVAPGGAMEIINSAYSTVLLRLYDTGNLELAATPPAFTNTVQAATTAFVRRDGGFGNMQVFTTAIATNPVWTVPAGVTKVRVTVVGGGGAGGGSAAATGDAGAGGGGGAVGVYYFSGLTPGGNVTYNVGNGATGVSGAIGPNGGQSNVTVGTTTINAPGGSGGTLGAAINTPYAGGAGGTIATQTNGTAVSFYGQVGSAGGNSVGTAAAGTCIGGMGAAGYQGQGAGRGKVGATAGSAGAAGTGAGGGGSNSGTAAATAGLNGGSGAVIFEF
jgi:hypothetical protein